MSWYQTNRFIERDNGDQEMVWRQFSLRDMPCFWWMIREQEHRLMKWWQITYLKNGENRSIQTDHSDLSQIESHWMIIEGYLRQSITKQTTLENHGTDATEVTFISFQFSQWRKIYPFIIMNNSTPHYQFVLVVVASIVNRRSIITRITNKSPLTKLNGL